MIIGNFTYDPTSDACTGEIKTLTLQRSDVQIRAATKSGQQGPDYRIVEQSKAGSIELGAAWKKTSKAGSEFLSVSLDDPAMLRSVNAALMPGENDTAILIWSRPARAKKED